MPTRGWDIYNGEALWERQAYDYALHSFQCPSATFLLILRFTKPHCHKQIGGRERYLGQRSSRKLAGNIGPQAMFTLNDTRRSRCIWKRARHPFCSVLNHSPALVPHPHSHSGSPTPTPPHAVHRGPVVSGATMNRPGLGVRSSGNWKHLNVSENILNVSDIKSNSYTEWKAEECVEDCPCRAGR